MSFPIKVVEVIVPGPQGPRGSGTEGSGSVEVAVPIDIAETQVNLGEGSDADLAGGAALVAGVLAVSGDISTLLWTLHPPSEGARLTRVVFHDLDFSATGIPVNVTPAVGVYSGTALNDAAPLNGRVISAPSPWAPAAPAYPTHGLNIIPLGAPESPGDVEMMVDVSEVPTDAAVGMSLVAFAADPDPAGYTVSCSGITAYWVPAPADVRPQDVVGGPETLMVFTQANMDNASWSISEPQPVYTANAIGYGTVFAAPFDVASLTVPMWMATGVTQDLQNQQGGIPVSLGDRTFPIGSLLSAVNPTDQTVTVYKATSAGWVEIG